MIDQSVAYDLLSHEHFAEKLKLYHFDEAIGVNPTLEEGPDVCSQNSLAGQFHIVNSNDMPACHEEGESVIDVDDDTDSVHAGYPDQLVEKEEKEKEKLTTQ